MHVLVVVPTYNERGNISCLVEKIEALSLSLSVLVIDDNSPDGTEKEIKSLQTKYNNIFLLERSEKLGLGSAYREGFRYALENNYDAVVQMDADLSHSPSYLPAMLSRLDEYDLVIGSRYVEGGGVKNWGLFRRLLSYSANKISSFLLDAPISDLTSGFKCIRREALERINFSALGSEGYAFNLEVAYAAWRKGVKIAEYPIIFRGRKRDKSKMSLPIAIEAVFLVFSLFIRRLCRMFL